MKKSVALMIGAGMLSAHLGPLHAAVTAEEARKLGTTLTLFGAEKAGNKEGTIPEYTGGLTTPPAGFDKAKGIRPDPFASEKPLFSIDAKNMDKYADKLTAGTKALMKAYPDYRIDVYPTHRTVAYPKSVLDNSVKNATVAKLSDDGLSMSGARGGTPFPIPKTGNEVMFNFQARYQGGHYKVPKMLAYNVDSAGKPVFSVQADAVVDFPFYDQSKSVVPTEIMRVRMAYTAPTRRAGEQVLIIDPMDYTDKGRRAWQYLPGQRRVRAAPDLSYDTPLSSTGGMSTLDDSYLFNGKMDRFNFELIGKKEMYVPYNAYRLTYHDKPEDVLKPKFINPAMVRWELHRMWVVEAKLKEGKRHIYSKRTFYIDEDSWAALASDQYDGRGQLWRPGFSYEAPAYDASIPSNLTYGHYDLSSGAYYISSWAGGGGMTVSESLLPGPTWNAETLAGQGVR